MNDQWQTYRDGRPALRTRRFPSLALQAGIFVFAVAVATLGARAQDARPARLQFLADFEIAPNKESVGDYLTSLHPSTEERKVLERLVAELGSDSYVRREAATDQLLRRTLGCRPL